MGSRFALYLCSRRLCASRLVGIMVNRRVCVSCNLIWLNILVFFICQEIVCLQNGIKIFQTRTLAPQRGRGDTLGTPYGIDFNNHSGLTRRGFRIRGGFASFSEYCKPQPKKHCSVDWFCYLCTANRIMLVYNATKRVGKELPMRFSIDRILKIDIWLTKPRKWKS